MKKAMTYEEAYKKLEEILEKMGKGDLSLEDSMKYFDEASKLYKHCEELLVKAEGEIKVILEKDDEKVEVDFSMEV